MIIKKAYYEKKYTAKYRPLSHLVLVRGSRVWHERLNGGDAPSLADVMIEERVKIFGLHPNVRQELKDIRTHLQRQKRRKSIQQTQIIPVSLFSRHTNF